MKQSNYNSGYPLITSFRMGKVYRASLILWALLGMSMSGWAQEKQNLWPPRSKANADSTQIPSVLVYRPNPEKVNGASVLICPGGAYGFLALSQEGIPSAQWFASLGITAFLLQYRHGTRHPHPQPSDDATRALRWIRQQAPVFGLSPHKIGIVGFSAGGHLASTIGTHFDSGKPQATDSLSRISSRPDFMVLIYPVVSMKKGITHVGSRNNLLGMNPPLELIRHLSNETQVSPQTPITFLVHSSDDRTVPVENSLLLYKALKKMGISTEMHIFEKGDHGYGLGNAQESDWTSLCESWLRRHRIIP